MISYLLEKWGKEKCALMKEGSRVERRQVPNPVDKSLRIVEHWEIDFFTSV